jgi:hypothetical protein
MLPILMSKQAWLMKRISVIFSEVQFCPLRREFEVGIEINGESSSYSLISNIGFLEQRALV